MFKKKKVELKVNECQVCAHLDGPRHVISAPGLSLRADLCQDRVLLLIESTFPGRLDFSIRSTNSFLTSTLSQAIAKSGRGQHGAVLLV